MTTLADRSALKFAVLCARLFHIKRPTLKFTLLFLSVEHLKYHDNMQIIETFLRSVIFILNIHTKFLTIVHLVCGVFVPFIILPCVF